MKKYKSIICIVLFIACQMISFAQTQYYPQHFVIVVDQGAVQGHDNMPRIYQKLKDYFIEGKNIFNDNCEFPIFNPNTDQISIFASSIYGSNYKKIFNGCNPSTPKCPEDKITNILTNSLFHEHNTDYQTFASNGDLTTFLSQNLEPLLKRSWKEENIHAEDKVIGLNGYLYPLIINKITSTTPAEKYYFFIISNFAQQGSERDTDDAQLKPLLGIRPESQTYKYWNAFQKDISQLECDFYRNPHPSFFSIPINHPTPANNKNNPKIDFFGLKISKLEQASAILTQQPTFQQLKLHGKDFQCNPTIISFNHPENLQIIDCWEDIETNDTTIIRQYKLNENVRQQKQGAAITYIIDKQNFALGQLKPDDKIVCTYHFYTSITNQQGDTLLPMVFSTQPNTYTLRKSDFIPEPIKLSGYIIISILIATLFLMLLGYWVWKRRGKTRDIHIEDFRIWPISHSRYMEIKDKHVINYDCWYWRGANDICRQIQITGKVIKEKKKFAKQYKYRVEYLIADADSNADFSFRPSGKNGAAQQLEANTFYQIPLNYDGEFSFNAEAYINPAELEKQDRLEPNFDINNILEMRVTTKITIYDGNKILKTIEKEYPKYSFIVRPSLERPDLWVSFDLGTTGSCMAFGQAASLAQRDNIYMVNNRNVGITTDDQHFIPIFPSKIIIPENSRLFTHAFNIETAMENKDYVFGNRAEQHWNENRNRFQSIKKLLGYTTIQKIYKRDGSSVDISGQDLAFLLAKGIFNRFETDLMNYQPETIRNIFVDSDDNIQIERAIVAVPNNYMLNKVQEMVDSVKRLNKFKEVHYLYESEGVFMTYLSQELPNLQGKHDTIFVVYDMGGATINITAFKIRCITRTQNGVTNISRIEVDTLAKVGYAVGGDDIDFAIIQFLYSIPSISAKFKSEKDKFEHQQKHKNKLIEIARKIKLDWIEKNGGKTSNGNVTQNIETFLGHIQAQLKNIGIDFSSMEDEDEALSIKDKDKRFIKNEVNDRTVLKKYVFEYVRDCTQELVNSLHLSKKENIELILSGRSILYPGIKENVLSVLKDSVSQLIVWKGFEKPNGSFDDESIKTAVAKGACWYAMNGGQIELRHDIISFSFGYLDTINGKLKFIPLIDKLKNPRFDEDGICASIPVQPYDSNIYTVDFVQMLGTNYDKIYDGEVKIPHKINILDRIDQSVITGKVESISVSIDKENNFDYTVEVNGLKDPIRVKTNPHSKFGKDNVKTEIADENSKAYTFAAVNTCDENDKQ